MIRIIIAIIVVMVRLKIKMDYIVRIIQDLLPFFLIKLLNLMIVVLLMFKY